MQKASWRDGFVRQDSLLICAPIRPGALQSLRTVLRGIAHPASGGVAGNPVLPFARLTRVHFARLLILPEVQGPPAPEGKRGEAMPLPAQLVFASDFDGTLADHLRELTMVAAPGLDEVFGHCIGWVPIAGRDCRSRYLALVDFVGRHAVRANTFYTGTMKRSVAQIQREARLREAIDTLLDREAGSAGFPDTAIGVHERVRTYVFNHPDFTWLHERPGPMPFTLAPLLAPGLALLFTPERTAQRRLWGAVAAAIAVALLQLVLPLSWSIAIVAAVVAVVLAWIGTVSYLNARDPVIIRRDVGERTSTLVTLEDHILQNQITTINYIKRPGWLRRTQLRLVLAFVNSSARMVENQGTLSGIPSIHFARWVVVDRGKRLIFLSNFDGTWESYLGDFVDKAHQGLTLIWSNVFGFPRTHKLTRDGAADEQRFKAIARDSQLPTDVWYSAYPSLTVANINDNSRLRLGLYAEFDEAAAQQWLRMAAPKKHVSGTPPVAARSVVDAADVQGLAARSYRDLPHAAYLLLAFTDGADARRWLGALVPRVSAASLSSDEIRRHGVATNVAFTRSGLRVLGLCDAAVTGFSREFTEGMAGNPHRQRLLGDVGDAAAEKWQWGGPRSGDVHAVLFLFADTAERLAQRVRDEYDHAKANGVCVTERLDTRWLGRKEHFGFDDGIAQPRIAGLRRDGESTGPAIEIPAGEVILGYPNAYGRLPLSPTVDENTGSASLPPSPPDAARLARARDFGCNGSYVVLRTLEQDVRGFWEQSDRLAASDREKRKFVAAKMIGRWPNGAPLAQYPLAEPAGDDARRANAFTYADDLDGDKCPLGAHVRRANPRAGLRPDTLESQKVSGRHRLVRRGRSYGPPLSETFDPDEILRTPAPDRGRGLHFICMNTDIARQFEFVQSTWINSGKFDGMYDDPDPMIAPRGDMAGVAINGGAVFTVQKVPVRERHRTLGQFVTMVGGFYLFMPGLRALRYLTTIE